VAAMMVGLLVGAVVAKKKDKWAVSSHEERRAELLTRVEVEHEILGKAAKEFYKMEGKKPPTKVEDVDIFEKNNPSKMKAQGLMAEMKHDWMVMQYGPEKAKEMEKKGTELQMPEAKDTSMTDALVESAARDYTKATGLKAIPKAKQEIVNPRNEKEVFQMLEEVGAKLHEMKNGTKKRFVGASQAYKQMVDRKIIVPDRAELGESEYERQALDDAMAGGAKEAEGILGLDKADESYEADKTKAQAILEQQVDNTNYDDVDAAVSDNDRVPDDDAEAADLDMSDNLP